MPKQIDREEVRQLMDAGAQVVEVLPQAEYEDEHLRGAINIPLKQLNAQTASVLEQDRPIIVYCHDQQ